MTLLTCTPYMINSHRLLVRGHRIPYVEADEPIKAMKFNFKDVIWPALTLIIVLLIIFIYKKFRRRRYE